MPTIETLALLSIALPWAGALVVAVPAGPQAGAAARRSPSCSPWPAPRPPSR